MSETKKFYVGGTAYDVSISGQTFDHGMPDAWVANATTQYNALVAAMKEVSLSGIPFFITTDHHGDGTYGQQWLEILTRISETSIWAIIPLTFSDLFLWHRWRSRQADFRITSAFLETMISKRMRIIRRTTLISITASR